MRYMHLFKTIIILISTSLSFRGSLHAQDIKPATDFGAFYTNIKAGADWETFDRTGEYADIIVNLGAQNGQFVFWRGTSYLPYWINAVGEKFFVDEIIKRQGNGSSVMPDRVNTYSHVRLISATDEVAVVHWRYLPDFAGSNPHIGVLATNFVDEYYAISADGKVKRTIKEGTQKIEPGPEDLPRGARLAPTGQGRTAAGSGSV